MWTKILSTVNRFCERFCFNGAGHFAIHLPSAVLKNHPVFEYRSLGRRDSCWNVKMTHLSMKNGHQELCHLLPPIHNEEETLTASCPRFQKLPRVHLTFDRFCSRIYLRKKRKKEPADDPTCKVHNY